MTPERRRIHGIHVTEHAIVRYLERRYGIDVKELLAELVPYETAQLLRRVKNGRVGIKHNLWLVVADGTVVTVAPTDGRQKPTRAGRRHLEE
jgi:hypothetical protein